VLALLCLALFASGCSLRSGSRGDDSGVSSSKVSGAAISKTALSTVGTRYVYGGSSPAKGFDCSGLVSWAYANNGVTVPRTAKAQSAVGSSVPRASLRPGDVVVFRISSGLHTGIYTGKGRFVHSPSTGKKVRVDNVNNQYWRDRFVAGRRHTRVY
jgi:cell wall-associated NlpC family hydrolase